MPAKTVTSAAWAGTANETTNSPKTPAAVDHFLMTSSSFPRLRSLADLVAWIERSEIREQTYQCFRQPLPRLPIARSRISLRSIRATPRSHRPVDFVRRPRRHRVAVDHEQHGETGVMADEGDQLDNAALADERRHGLEVGVAHLPGAQQLRGEIVHRGLVRRHVGGPLACRQGGNESGAEACIQRLLAVRVPHILAAPIP